MNFRRFIFFIGLIILSQRAAAQNLVPNGSFEEYSDCPGSYSENPAAFRATSWRALNTGSPDYFNTCSDGGAAVPYNWAGVSEAFDGYGYAGIYTWMNLEKEYREYLHCKLTEPLIKDSVYLVSFRYKLSSYSKFSTDRIGLLLSDSLKPIPNDRPIKFPPTFSFVKDSALTLETGAWELAAAEYRAEGSEQFLTVGNFSDNGSTHFYHIQFRPASEPMLANSAYYYIDDVKVVPKYSSIPKELETPVLTEADPELNTLYVLDNIQFEFNRYSLLPVSYQDLDKVVIYMLDHPQVSVRLTGHTDDVGSYGYNFWLSDLRAKSAAAYLMSKGIAENRVYAVGYGESRPSIELTTEEAREKNRRVEIEFFIR
jgi:OmpA-OmpF porin, OOP family